MRKKYTFITIIICIIIIAASLEITKKTNNKTNTAKIDKIQQNKIDNKKSVKVSSDGSNNESTVSKTSSKEDSKLDETVPDSVIILNVTNAYNSFKDVTSCINISDNIMKINDNYYAKLTKQYNTYDKLLLFLSKTYSEAYAKKVISYLNADIRNGAYSILVGQEGEQLDLKNAYVVNKTTSEGKTEAYLRVKYSDGYEANYKVVLVKQNGQYHLDYFQYLDGLFGK